MNIFVIMMCILKFGIHELLSYSVWRMGMFACFNNVGLFVKSTLLLENIKCQEK